MHRGKDAYEAVSKFGVLYQFKTIADYNDFIVKNPQLFNDLPIIQEEEVEVAREGFVNPDHYKNRKYEVFDVMRDTQGYERHIGYLEGCVIKYMMRWDKKHDDPLMDLKKAQRYLEQLIQTIEQQEEDKHAMASNGE